ncbi:hypothetical protein N7474_006402 [Penicillium riverlandense]|uniref:uncharacterized protein n=1 Tax=Penicillium riverlandense TaxID=1903569 RepID=UPI00254950F8|nr:uncharacterized protein N7474_006402 [Penicillium riverlandense]KAJ5814625.1 hypothetical protein N7474_006402 [Penicillium riverlandense]
MVENGFHKEEETEHIEVAPKVVLAIVDESVRGPGDGPVLIPQPTQDPNDPLNWTSFEKYLTCLTVCFFTILSTFNSSNLVVALVPISNEFRQTQTKTGYVVCFNLLLMGVGNLLWVPLSRVIGKRPVYLFALLLLTGCNIGTYEASSYGSLLASRIVSGLAGAAADSTVPSLIADLFFVHERGHCMMIFHFALSTGFFIGPLICAYITQEVGWRWTSGLLAIAGGATFLVGIFTIRESNYQRDTANVDLPASEYPPKRSFLSWMALSHGYRPDVLFFKAVWNTICLAAYPPIIWTGFLVGTFVGWYSIPTLQPAPFISSFFSTTLLSDLQISFLRNIVVQMTASRVFTQPPFTWKIGNLGLLALAGFIGALVAFFLGGKLIDLISTRMTKANRGIRKPEFRLPAIILPAVIGPIGVLTFGICTARHLSWVGAAFGYAMQGFGLTAVSNVVVTYAVDSYHQVAGEALVVVFVIRNTIATLLALYTVNWQEATGIENAFGQMVAMQYFFLLFAIPMFYYGKRIRDWTASYGPLVAIFDQERKLTPQQRYLEK